MRAKKPVPGRVAEGTGGRAAPRAARTAVGVEQCSGCGGVETALAASADRGGGEPTRCGRVGNVGVPHEVRATRTRIFVAAAVDVGRRERNAGFPRAEAGDLPAAKEEVG